MKTPLIQFENVHKKFGNNPVLTGVNLNIYKNEICTIIGKSGGGKSVLLKHIIGLLEPDSGRILFEGKPLSKMRKAEKTAIKQKSSYMFQGTALFDSITVFDNVALPLKERTAMRESQIRKRVVSTLSQLDLAMIENNYPSQLSGGMKKRVALARALVTDPEIVLFDEPTTGLDPIRKNAVHSMIADYQKRFGFTGVVVSHEIPDIFYISQRIAMLDNGQILFEGSPEDIQTTSNPSVMEFIRGLESGHDDMTGLAEIPMGKNRFIEEMSKMHRYDQIFSIIVFKVENIDEINEKSNHITGQTAIKNFTDELKRNLRSSDICFRYSMDKIMTLLPHTHMHQAQLACEKLRRQMKMANILKIQPYPGFCFTVSASFAEAQKNSRIEQVIAQAQEQKNILCEFRVC